jgi:glycosyltransferase involved in cell wall biosynthesis
MIATPSLCLPRTLHVVGGVGMGGVERFSVRLINALHRRGAPVAAFTVRNGEVANALAPGVQQYHAPMFSNWDLYSRWRIRQAIKAFSPDIVQTYMGRATRLVLISEAKKPIHVARPGGYYGGRQTLHAHACVVTTQDVRRYFSKAGLPDDRICVIGNFVDPVAPIPSAELLALRNACGFKPGDTVILGLGRFHPNKGWSDLIQACSILKGEFPEQKLKLVLVGDGPLKNQLVRKAREAGLTQDVYWAGWQQNTDAWYQMADVFVCASHHEPFGNVILEAWANRSLIVSTRSEGPSELIQDGVDGLLTPVADPTSLAQTLRRALALNPADRARMIEAGAAKLNAQFSEAAIVRQYLDFYRQLLTEHRHG